MKFKLIESYSKKILLIIIVILFNFLLSAQSSDTEYFMKIINEQNRQIEILKSRIDNIESASFLNYEKSSISDILGKKIKLYGYCNINYTYFDFENRNITLSLDYPPHTSFSISNFNMYIDSKIDENINFLGELEYIFAPEGQYSVSNIILPDTNGYLKIYDGLIVKRDSSELENTKGGKLSKNSLFIRQVWIDYTFKNFLSLKFGKFPIPYGFYNVDRSPYVLIPARVPLVIAFEMMPSSITGININSSKFIEDGLLKYNFIIGNGRGNSPSLFDINNHKAYGFSWDYQKDIELSGINNFQIGGAAYFDKIDYYFEILDPAENYQKVNRTLINSVKEKTYTAHFGFESKKIFFKSEWLYSYHNFSLLNGEIPFSPFDRNEADGNLLKNKNSSYGFYFLNGYKLSDMITLYYLYEKFNCSFSYDSLQGNTYGINYRITPYFIFKSELSNINFKDFSQGNFKYYLFSVSAAF
jgi:hypothetical protein